MSTSWRSRACGLGRTKDQRMPAERDHNRLKAGLRALVEQAIGHLAKAWTLRRWCGLLYRVRDVYRAAAALSSASADGSTASRHEKASGYPH